MRHILTMSSLEEMRKNVRLLLQTMPIPQRSLTIGERIEIPVGASPPSSRAHAGAKPQPAPRPWSPAFVEACSMTLHLLRRPLPVELSGSPSTRDP